MTKHHENKRRPRRGSASQRAKIRSRAKRLLVEGLEQRTLLDGALRSTAEVASALSGKTITGVTIVSHGLTLANDGGDQLLPLAAAIRNRIGPDKAWLLDYDVSGEGGTAGFDVSAIEDSGGGPLPGAGATSGEVVLLYDWAPESQEAGPLWREAAGDGLFNLLIGLGLVQPLQASGQVISGSNNSIKLGSNASSLDGAYKNEVVYISGGTGAGQWRTITSYAGGNSHIANVSPDWTPNPNASSSYAISKTPPLHFIGHGSGAVVVSEAVERLGAVGVPVDEVTYLDPHDFTQTGNPLDLLTPSENLASPAGYGAAVWQNVSFADVYYQTLGRSGELFDMAGLSSSALVQSGRPIPGAYNELVNSALPSPFAIGSVASPVSATSVQATAAVQYSSVVNFYKGQYLAFIDGPAKGEFRPVASYNPSPPTFAIDPLLPFVKTPAAGSHFVLLDPAAFPDDAKRASFLATFTADLEGDHTQVWKEFYLKTVTGQISGKGYDLFSRVAGGVANRSTAGAPNFYSAGQDHKWTAPGLVAGGMPDTQGLAALGLTPTQVVAGRWKPEWVPLEITNGNLSAPGDVIPFTNSVLGLLGQTLGSFPWAGEIDLLKGAPSNIVPGWSDHEGGGLGRVITSLAEAPNLYLELGKLSDVAGTSAPSRTHNAVYVPAQTLYQHLFLVFDLQVKSAAAGEVLSVWLGGKQLLTEKLELGDPNFRTIWFDIDSTPETAALRKIAATGVRDLEAG